MKRKQVKLLVEIENLLFNLKPKPKLTHFLANWQPVSELILSCYNFIISSITR